MRGLVWEDSDGVPIVRLPVDVDAANAESIGEEVAAGVSHDPAGLIVDLTATRYLDSAGIDMLFRLGERLRTRRQALHLVAPEGAPVRRVLEIVSMSETLPVHGELTFALGAVGGDETPTPASP